MSLLRVQKVYSPAPPIWRLWLVRHLDCSHALAEALWKHFARTASAEELFLVRQADETRYGIRPLLAKIRPSVLLSLTQMVSPCTGRPRLPEVVRLEETILERTIGNGEWQ